VRFEINSKFQPEEAKLRILEDRKREKEKKERRKSIKVNCYVFHKSPQIAKTNKMSALYTQ
jgi:hypothetical protein